MSNRLDRNVYGPSWTEVVFGAILSFVLGVVIAVALLVLKPVVAVKELPKEEERVANAVYYVEGSRLTIRATRAMANRKALIEGQSVTVTEDEINSLVEAAATPAPKPAEKKSGENAAPTTEDVLATGTPNVRIRNGVMQVAVPVTVSVLGVKQKTIVQARGGFAKKSEGFVFEPTEFYLGSCPVQRLPFLAGYARNKLLATQPVPADIATAWSKLANVEIDGNLLKLTMP